MSEFGDDARRRRAHQTIDRLQEALLAHDMSAFATIGRPTAP